jgi:hypothetical protein
MINCKLPYSQVWAELAGGPEGKAFGMTSHGTGLHSQLLQIYLCVCACVFERERERERKRERERERKKERENERARERERVT